jgi:hypothetical protein
MPDTTSNFGADIDQARAAVRERLSAENRT